MLVFSAADFEDFRVPWDACARIWEGISRARRHLAESSRMNRSASVDFAACNR